MDTFDKYMYVFISLMLVGIALGIIVAGIYAAIHDPLGAALLVGAIATVAGLVHLLVKKINWDKI